LNFGSTARARPFLASFLFAHRNENGEWGRRLLTPPRLTDSLKQFGFDLRGGALQVGVSPFSKQGIHGDPDHSSVY